MSTRHKVCATNRPTADRCYCHILIQFFIHSFKIRLDITRNSFRQNFAIVRLRDFMVVIRQT